MTALTPHLDLFAGPGGWDTGIAPLGIRPAGVEWDIEAVHTAQAAGHHRIGPFWTDEKGREHGPDIATLDPVETWRRIAHTRAQWQRDLADGAIRTGDTFALRGLIASPPCQGFSTAGKGKGRDDSIHLLEALRTVQTRRDVEAVIADLGPTMTDPRTLLVLEPLRWALALTPSWLAWEQVPGVLPLWEACADVLRRIGYSVATGVISAETVGVPQTRRRAILVARAPWFTREHGPATLPPATHSRYHSRDPKRLDPGVKPWVSMAEALGSTPGEVAYRARDLRHVEYPAQTVTEKSRSWQFRANAQPNAAVRPIDSPAPTITGGHDTADRVWEDDGTLFAGAGQTAVDTSGQRQRPTDEPAHTVTGKGTAAWVPTFNDQSGTPFDPTWPDQRPATTVAGRDLVPNPGATANRYNGSTKSRNDGVRVTVQEAAVLQSFPADYPWQGNKTAQYRQVGDAVPPGLARAIVAHVAAIVDDGPGVVPSWRARGGSEA